jgi:hypothetical protein
MSKNEFGNTVRAQQVFDQQIQRLGLALGLLDHICSAGWTGEVELLNIKVRLGSPGGEETLVIVTGTWGDGTPVVAFHAAQSPSDAVAGCLNRIRNGTMKWREDQYAKGTGNAGTGGAGDGGSE